jgi:hypothetical protein
MQTAAANTMNSIQNSQTMQNIANGPVADKARAEAATTKNEFSNLAAARQTPDIKTATGQNLTHYHSLFYSLLSWENPRATAISFATIVTGILLARFVPVERYVLKAVFTTLGVVSAAELAGHFILGQGLATKMRPRKYYTIPRETLESITGDVEELINFFVIEFQLILFAENVWATLAVSRTVVAIRISRALTFFRRSSPLSSVTSSSRSLPSGACSLSLPASSTLLL